MKYKIILLFFLTSCINNTHTNKNSFTFSSKGFAYVNEQSFDGLQSDKFLVFHNKLRLNKKVRISNPINKKSIEAIVKKKIKYDNFYKVLISQNIAEKLNLDLNFPYVEIVEIKLNKSFIAKKAVTESIEKKIANSAPVDKININNLSKIKKVKKNKSKTYSILVADFYNLRSAELLKDRLTSVLVKSNYQLIYINKKNNKSYELLMGPYKTIKKLKNDYIVLNDSNFEDLDIKIND